MKSKYIIMVVLIILAFALAIFSIKNQKIDLSSKCCAECIEGFQQQWAIPLYCVNKSKMSSECIDYLGIKDLTGISTFRAYSDKCE